MTITDPFDTGAPCPDNIMLWNAVIFGPGESAEKNDCSIRLWQAATHETSR